MKFPQLYTKTSYSLLKSTFSVEEYVKQAKARGYQTLAICDEDTLAGTIEFYEACQKYQVTPIIGLELSFAFQDSVDQLLLFAKNLAGYQKLMALSSERLIQAKPYEFSESADYFTDLAVVYPCKSVEQLAQVKEIQQLVTPEVLVGCVMDESGAVVAQTCQQQGLAAILIHPVRYLNSEDAFAVKVMENIQAGTQLANEELTAVSGNEALQSREQLNLWVQEHNLVNLAEQTVKLAATCKVNVPLNQTLLPHYPVPDQIQSAGEYLQQLCWKKLPQRVGTVTNAYQQRLTMELEIIHKMGFDDYFLIVWDVMDYIHRSQIVTGAGRGSAAGSLVAYVLAITEVDPLKYDLLFERFLNPERNSMPDIDLDIPDNKRSQVLDYVNQKYGRYHVAQIATFGTMAAKQALRDVSRVFGLSQSEAMRWSKAVPNQLKITLKEAYENSRTMRELVAVNEKSRLLFQTALKLEGLPRHVSTHAAGVVISDQNLVELVPLQSGADELLQTQFTMTDVEKIGLLKMDFLGLRNLSIIATALETIERVYHEKVDLKQIPLDDEKTLQLFQKGATSGVFQFESAGIRNVLRRLGPTSIEDIAAVNALYRPGPMQNIDHFIARKKSREPINYPEKSLEPILSNTYGIIVYQEQIMQVASKMAGFSLGQADILRRAVSKKKKAVLDEERQHFVSGAKTQGYSEQSAQAVYDYIERFANYGFNRSHAFAYSFVGYQMAYLKVHYPGAFFTALLRSVRNDQKKIREYAAEAKKMGIVLLAPDINKSQYSFTLTSPTEIRFGLDAIKGMRRDFVGNIIETRQNKGGFSSLERFLLQIDTRWLKEELVTPLLLVGAFDSLEPNRRKLVEGLAGKIQNVEYSGGNVSLLDVMSLKEEELADYPLAEKLDYEEQYLGFYVSGHPSENYPKILQQETIQSVDQLVTGQTVKVLLYIKDVREIRTKKGEQMAFLTGNDQSGEVALTIFPQLYRKLRNGLAINHVYLITGRVETSRYDQALQVLVEQLVAADELEETLPAEKLYLKIPKSLDTVEFHRELTEKLKTSPGKVPVIIYFEKNQQKIVLNKEFWIRLNDDLADGLRDLLGESNVVIG